MILTTTAVKYTAIVGVAAMLTPIVAVLSEGMLTAILVAIPAILTVLGVIIVNVITALKKTVDQVKETAGKIEGHVNSAATAAKGKIEGLEKELVLMRETLAENTRVAALLAQSRAVELAAKGTGLSSPASPTPVVIENPDPVPVTVKKP